MIAWGILLYSQPSLPLSPFIYSTDSLLYLGEYSYSVKINTRSSSLSGEMHLFDVQGKKERNKAIRISREGKFRIRVKEVSLQDVYITPQGIGINVVQENEKPDVFILSYCELFRRGILSLTDEKREEIRKLLTQGQVNDRILGSSTTP